MPGEEEDRLGLREDAGRSVNLLVRGFCKNAGAVVDAGAYHRGTMIEAVASGLECIGGVSQIQAGMLAQMAAEIAQRRIKRRF